MNQTKLVTKEIISKKFLNENIYLKNENCIKKRKYIYLKSENNYPKSKNI